LWAQGPQDPIDPVQRNADSGETKSDNEESETEESEAEIPVPPPPKNEDAPESEDSETESEANQEEDGVIGPVEEDDVDEGVFDKITEVNEKFGVIFRPQVGLTTISGNDDTFAGYHAGIHIGYHKSYRLKLADIGWYTRTRTMLLPTFGEVYGSEMRLGSFVGVKLTAMEIETGLDVLRHKMSVSDQPLDFDADVGLAIPVRALIVFDDVKIKAGVEPRMYLGSNRTPINWEEQAFETPLSDFVHEFSWNVGARIGVVGLSYDQLHMNGGIQRVISLGLQR
jgi:hypothetical protein